MYGEVGRGGIGGVSGGTESDDKLSLEACRMGSEGKGSVIRCGILAGMMRCHAVGFVYWSYAERW